MSELVRVHVDYVDVSSLQEGAHPNYFGEYDVPKELWAQYRAAEKEVRRVRELIEETCEHIGKERRFND